MKNEIETIIDEHLKEKRRLEDIYIPQAANKHIAILCNETLIKINKILLSDIT